MRGKFGNRKIKTSEGVFDSKIELERWHYLLKALAFGTIRNLERQTSFELIPRQSTMVTVHLKTKDKIVEKFLEHPVHYIADFTYEKLVWKEENDTQIPTWERVVEDCKGRTSTGWSTETPDFRIKKKLMLFIHGIQIRIITKATEEI